MSCGQERSSEFFQEEGQDKEDDSKSKKTDAAIREQSLKSFFSRPYFSEIFMKIRVLHAFASSLPYLSGYAIRSHKILKYQKYFCDPIAITSPYYDCYNSIEKIDGIIYYRSTKSVLSKIIDFLKIPLFRNISIERDFEKQLRKLIKEFKPDIIHAHSSHHVGICGYKVARQFKIPFVYEMRGLWEDTRVAKGELKEDSFRYKYNKNRETFLAANADRVFVISENLREDLVKRGISFEKITVIPNGVDRHDFSPSYKNNLRIKHNLQGSVILGYIGSLSKYESLDLLLEVMSHFVNRKKMVKGLIVGYGPEFNNLIQLSNKLGIQDNIRFTGRISPNAVREYYSLIDIFILTRCSGREVNLVTPLKPFEAMEAGNCLLLSDLPALKEIIEDNVTGLLYKESDKYDLISKCELLIEDDSLRRRLGKAARTWVLENRRWDSVVRKYLPHYNRLLNRKSYFDR